MDTFYNFIPKTHKKHESKTNENKYTRRVELPIPPEDIDQRFELDIYVRFMRYLRHMPNRRMDLKVLSAIESVANATKAPADLISKALVDMGLKAPKSAFPGSFIDFCERSMTRLDCPITGPQSSIREIIRHWHMTDDCSGQNKQPHRREKAACECKQFETVMI